MNYKPGQKVDLEILRKTDLGFVAKINGIDEGLLYHNEIFEELLSGQRLPGYIARIRETGEIDLLLQQFGSRGSEELGQKILEHLRNKKGFLPMNSNSPADDIYDLFGVSKKKFKMAIGALYKKRLITITDEGIKLVATKPS